MDAANILKPALARELRYWATTLDEPKIFWKGQSPRTTFSKYKLKTRYW
jgi:ATP-dependent Clp protease ATP-binding subunit ClpA